MRTGIVDTIRRVFMAMHAAFICAFTVMILNTQNSPKTLSWIAAIVINAAGLTIQILNEADRRME